MTGSGTPRRIMMVAHSHRVGGIERHVVMLSKALSEAGHPIAYAGPLNGWMGEQMQVAGHHCCHVPMHGMYDPWSAWRLARVARAWGAEVLHGHGQRGARYAAWGARWAGGLPSVATAHATNASRWFAPGQPVICVSGAVQEHLRSVGLPAADLRVVYSGVPDEGPVPLDGEGLAPAGVFDTAESLSGAAPRPLTLGMVARLEPVKGHDVALDALARLRAEPLERPLRLVFIGAVDTDWATQMRERVAALGLADQVIFTGQRSDVARCLGAIDVVLAPSRREALPLALLEAAMAARPVVGSRVGGVPEVVVDGEAGCLVPVDDAAALAAAVARLARDVSLRRRMGAAARQRFEALFTVPGMIQNTQAVYRMAIARQSRP